MSPSYICASCQAKQMFRLSVRHRPAVLSAVPRRTLASAAPRPVQWKRNALTPRRKSWSPLQALLTSHRGISGAAAAASDPFESEEAKIATDTGIAKDDLFHSFSDSPLEGIRRRARFIKRHAYCPHPDHKTPDAVSPEAGETAPAAVNATALPPAHANFECPDCGIPIYCGREHWMDHYDEHLEVCDTLREINEDDHDLRSGRIFSEFNYPGPQIIPEALINMTNWDTFLYTRQFEAINEMRRMRQVTRLLTYPTTLGSVIHELSPYQYKGVGRGRVTLEGVKSFSALQFTLHPGRDGSGSSIAELKPNPPMVRIFILGARAESSLPRDVWVQLTHMFPGATIHLLFIGPESMANRESEFPLPERTPENPFGTIVEDRVGPQMKISTIVDYYHNIHQTEYFAPYDPYFDAFMLFHPGFGNPISAQEWEPTVTQVLETKVPIICTGYSENDMMQDVQWLAKTAKGEYDMLLEPGENIFRSLRWDLNDRDPVDVSCANWGVWAFRGKRYDTIPKEDRIDEARRIS